MASAEAARIIRLIMVSNSPMFNGAAGCERPAKGCSIGGDGGRQGADVVAHRCDTFRRSSGAAHRPRASRDQHSPPTRPLGPSVPFRTVGDAGPPIRRFAAGTTAAAEKVSKAHVRPREDRPGEARWLSALDDRLRYVITFVNMNVIL
jgi:hypothetical protein